MKFGSSSSGCEPRPAKGAPTQPVASLATDAVTRPAMRRCAKVWAVGNAATKTISPKVNHKHFIPGGREGRIPRRRRRLLRIRARGSRARRGERPRHAVRGRSRHLGGPRSSSADTGATETRSSLSDAPRARGCARSRPTPRKWLSAQKKHPRRGRPQARGDRSRGRWAADVSGGVGGLRTSVDVGAAGWRPDPAEQRRPVLS